MGVEATSEGPLLAITRLVIVHTLFVPPLDANGAVVLLNVSFTAHPRPDRYRDDDGSDARPDHPRHASIVADHGVGRNNSYTRRVRKRAGYAARPRGRRCVRRVNSEANDGCASHALDDGSSTSV